MSGKKAEEVSRYRSMQVLLFVFSLIFFFIIAYGYFNLFLRTGYFLATVGAAIIALFAWYLARVIGTSPGGLRKNWILFLPLVVVSAAGVYNSLMLYLEGNRILADTVAESQGRFANLESVATRGRNESGITGRRNRINSLAEAFYSEIRNPLNCGQGPEAARRLAALQRELPNLTALSNPARDCSRLEEVVNDYKERVRDLTATSDWNNPSFDDIGGRATQARNTLEELRSNVTTNYAPTMLQGALSTLEAQDSVYRDLRHRLSQQVNVRDLPDGLHLSEAQSLGNAFKLPALFIERLDEPATYIYFLIAVGFDMLMIFLFELVSANRTRRVTADNSLKGAW